MQAALNLGAQWAKPEIGTRVQNRGGERGTIAGMYEHDSGRVPCLVKYDCGREGIPFLDELEVVE